MSYHTKLNNRSKEPDKTLAQIEIFAMVPGSAGFTVET